MRWAKILPISWLLFTFSLAAWWLVFGLQQLQKLAELNQSQGAEILRQHRMLLTEGVVLLVVVLMGGIALIYYSWREERRRRDMQNFLSGFTHELKTSLASLRLQSEILMEEEPSNPRLARLLREIARLEVQLENALLLAQPEKSKLYFETLALKEVLDRLAPLWPDLQIQFSEDVAVLADRRALESILKNLIQNAYHHGEAKQVKIHAEKEGSKIVVRVQDDGRGFKGSREHLGQAFFRQNGRSGSGLGLYLSRQLLAKMHGNLAVIPSTEGFIVDISLGAGA